MTMKTFGKSIVNGFAHGYIFSLLLDFVISIYAQDFSVIVLFVLSAFCAILVGTVFLLCLLKEKSNKAVILFSINSSLISVATIVLYLALPPMLPLRETNAGDGILILMLAGVFAIAAFILELVMFLVLVIRNIKTIDK